MKYNILIKATGNNKDLFKFFEENGQKYEVDNLEGLTQMYNKLIETMPTTLVIPIHALDVELNTEIKDCGNADPVDP